MGGGFKASGFIVFLLGWRSWDGALGNVCNKGRVFFTGQRPYDRASEL